MRVFEYLLLIALITCSPAVVLAHPAWGMAVDKSGNIYFADIYHNGMGTVWQVDPEGSASAILQDFHAHNVALGKSGEIYTAHGEGIHKLVVIEPGRGPRTLIETGDIDLFFGGNCAVSPNGRVYFGLRHYINEYNDGNPRPLSEFRLGWNQSMFVDSAENVYAGDISGSGDLYKFLPNGSVVHLATSLISQLGRPRDMHGDVLLGIHADDNGNVYVAETAGRRIVRIDPGCNVSTFYEADSGWMPTSVFARDSFVYVREIRSGSHDSRILRITKMGGVNVLYDQTAGVMRGGIVQHGFVPICLALAITLILTVLARAFWPRRLGYEPVNRIDCRHIFRQ